MATKKGWFSYAALVIFEICAAYALFSGLLSLAGSKKYPYLWYGGAICALAAAFLLLYALLRLIRRLRLHRRLAGDTPAGRITERIIAAAVLAAGAFARLLVIAHMPVTPASDYKTYYDVAVLLSQGGLGASAYIAKFPHVIGYPFVLSLLFRLTGPSVAAGLYLNAAAGLLSAFLTYRIARRLSSRLGGLIALVLAAFWPSQILYGAVLASEPVFTCLMLLAVWLFVYLFKYPSTLGNTEGSMFLCVITGIVLALSAAIRPLSQILLVAAVLSLLTQRVRFDVNERMLHGKLSRAACQGWFRALVILLVYVLCSGLISAAISDTIGYKLPGATVSYGYNLMVGVNIDAKGAWNQQDAEFFDQAFAATDSAEAAHRACIDVALRRIAADPAGVLNLTMEKFTDLWGNDDYGAYWVSLFLGQQGGLTPERQSVIDTMTRWSDYVYLLGIFFSALCGLRLVRTKDAGPELALFLLVIGTVVLHMVLESQNRYHYFLLPVFAMLSALYISRLYRGLPGKASPDML
ncbi:glycosyltransferase family 39 protein [Sporobacter termitidis]|uniref:glycosyltransferase family 39 protein n=1 Tax=Sporobacter termitidis TaxID=44749 RepID=UPI001356452F|nr:glycosyltransferase family 39 protein [Sporobacter termitidis]